MIPDCGHALRTSADDPTCPWCRDVNLAREGAELIARAKIDEARGQAERLRAELEPALRELYDALCEIDHWRGGMEDPPIGRFEEWLARRTKGAV